MSLSLSFLGAAGTVTGSRFLLEDGRVASIDNRSLARAAKLAGAPGRKAAGIEMLVKTGHVVEIRQPLFLVHADTRGELDYAMDYLSANRSVVSLDRGEVET